MRPSFPLYRFFCGISLLKNVYVILQTSDLVITAAGAYTEGNAPPANATTAGRGWGCVLVVGGEAAASQCAPQLCVVGGWFVERFVRALARLIAVKQRSRAATALAAVAVAFEALVMDGSAPLCYACSEPLMTRRFLSANSSRKCGACGANFAVPPLTRSGLWLPWTPGRTFGPSAPLPCPLWSPRHLGSRTSCASTNTPVAPLLVQDQTDCTDCPICTEDYSDLLPS